MKKEDNFYSLGTKFLFSFPINNKPILEVEEYDLAMQELDLCLKNFKVMYNNVDEIMNQLSNSNIIVHIYSTATLPNGHRIHSTFEFHGKPWFSNIEIIIDTDYQNNYENIYW